MENPFRDISFITTKNIIDILQISTILNVMAEAINFIFITGTFSNYLKNSNPVILIIQHWQKL